MKASPVVRADPDVLRLAAVTAAVQLALREPSISVREATLDLLGGYILQRPEFVEAYYPTIAARIADVGVSVRKRVIKILRELCLKQPASPRAVDACKHLVTRVGDEEAVHDLVLKTFHELWFGAGAAPPGCRRASGGARRAAGRCRRRREGEQEGRVAPPSPPRFARADRREGEGDEGGGGGDEGARSSSTSSSRSACSSRRMRRMGPDAPPRPRRPRPRPPRALAFCAARPR